MPDENRSGATESLPFRSSGTTPGEENGCPAEAGRYKCLE